MTSYSATKWWSRWEVYKEQFGDLEPSLQCDEDIAPATIAKRLPFFSNQQMKKTLQIELEATIDFGEPFVKAAYSLEGDWPLALKLLMLYLMVFKWFILLMWKPLPELYHREYLQQSKS